MVLESGAVGQLGVVHEWESRQGTQAQYSCLSQLFLRKKGNVKENSR